MAEYLRMLSDSKILSINQTHQEKYLIPKENVDVIPITQDSAYYLLDFLTIDYKYLHQTKQCGGF